MRTTDKLFGAGRHPCAVAAERDLDAAIARLATETFSTAGDGGGDEPGKDTREVLEQRMTERFGADVLAAARAAWRRGERARGPGAEILNRLRRVLSDEADDYPTVPPYGPADGYPPAVSSARAGETFGARGEEALDAGRHPAALAAEREIRQLVPAGDEAAALHHLTRDRDVLSFFGASNSGVGLRSSPPPAPSKKTETFAARGPEKCRPWETCGPHGCVCPK